MNKLILLLCVLLFTTQGLSAQEKQMPDYTETEHLNKGDVAKFLKTFKPIMTDFEALGESFSTRTTVQEMEALGAKSDAETILNKHGWTEDYYVKFSVVLLGYAQLKIAEEFEQMPEEQKQMLKDMGMDKLNLQYVNSSDLKLIKDKYADLDVLFEELESQKR